MGSLKWQNKRLIKTRGKHKRHLLKEYTLGNKVDFSMYGNFFKPGGRKVCEGGVIGPNSLYSALCGKDSLSAKSRELSYFEPIATWNVMFRRSDWRDIQEHERGHFLETKDVYSTVRQIKPRIDRVKRGSIHAFEPRHIYASQHPAPSHRVVCE